jgi:hypothetical protein
MRSSPLMASGSALECSRKWLFCICTVRTRYKQRSMSRMLTRKGMPLMTPGGAAFRSDCENEQTDRLSAIGPRQGRSTIEYGTSVHSSYRQSD